ncbi:MAG TPA: penicillin-binding protein 1B, partial [Chromatiaceae bacterium]|nr:penicillin-binding protein 1B [Chromatiaceae bacterium]
MPARKKKTVRRKPARSGQGRKGRRRVSTRKRRSRGWLKWVSGLVLLLILVVGGYSLYLSQIVRVKFEGKRWAVPARVYARPLELYAGARVSAEQLQAELELLGYRKVKHPKRPAQWSRAGSRFLVYGRKFLFWDGREPARLVEVKLNREGVSSLRDMSTRQEIDLLRMEAPRIGSIYPSHKEDRVLVKREQLPDHLVAALLAAEDRDYYHHSGVNFYSMARALLANLRAGRTVQGGSTLTQQLVKNFWLTPERSLWRKGNEVLMALILDARYGKDEILEAYANEVFLGQDGDRAIHGFGLASWFYFNRPLEELKPHETALLVGLLKGASYYNPRRHPERALQRRNLVLRLMMEQGFITPQQANAAQKQPLGVVKGGRRSSVRHPAFIDLVRRQLQRDYREEDLTSEGLRIFTTLDPWAQRILDRELPAGLQQIEKARRMSEGTLEGAAVVVSP